MPVKQHTTYYKDFTIKSYVELMDGIIVVYKEYNERGIISYEETNGEWTKWEYDEYGRMTYKNDHKNRWFRSSHYIPILLKNGETFNARFIVNSYDNEVNYYDIYDRLIKTTKSYGIDGKSQEFTTIISHDDDRMVRHTTWHSPDGNIEHGLPSMYSLPSYFDEIKEFYEKEKRMNRLNSLYEAQRLGVDIKPLLSI